MTVEVTYGGRCLFNARIISDKMIKISFMFNLNLNLNYRHTIVTSFTLLILHFFDLTTVQVTSVQKSIWNLE